MRWIILGILFLARMTMAFQFQSVAALTPFMTVAYGASLAEIGLMIGLYLAPGIVVAIPGGAVAARLGDTRVVAASMGLMLAGGLMASLLPGWEAALAGRVLAGVGGVVVNIVMTKMLVDWFAGREISTALAIFVNSWPVGIALALLVLPPIAATAGLAAARGATLVLIAGATLVFVSVYRPAPAAPAAPSVAMRPFPVPALVLAGLIWAIYNSALAMVFSFGAAALVGAGWALTTASALTSAFMVAFSLALPLGGVIADRTGRRDTVILVKSRATLSCCPSSSTRPSGPFRRS
jgi:MFS family permease